MRILIVEDETALRDSLSAAFQQHGYTVSAAADGEEGGFAGTEYQIDVAIIDMGLPKVPGLELIRRLRAQGKQFPILILDGVQCTDQNIDCLPLNQRSNVDKPCCAGLDGHVFLQPIIHVNEIRKWKDLSVDNASTSIPLLAVLPDGKHKVERRPYRSCKHQ